MLKPTIDITATIGNNFILINQPSDWTDFEDKSKVLGSIIEIGAVDKFEKFTVKAPVKKENIKIKNGSKIELINLTATPYIRGNFINISWKADDIKEIEGGFEFP